METNKKIKIAIVNDVFYPLVDGVVRVVDSYCRELAKLPNIDVTLVVPGPKRQEDFDKYYKDLPYKLMLCKLSGAGMEGYNKPILTPEFRKKFKEAKFDLVHCHSIFTLYDFAVKVAKKQKYPVILTVHSQYRPDFKRYLKLELLVKFAMKITKRTLNRCDLLFSINDKMDDYIREQVGFHGKSRIVRNATHFTSPANLTDTRKQGYKVWDIEENENVFCFVGRPIAEKGIFIILQALEIIKKRGIPFKMIYVGGGFDLGKLQAEIKKLGMEKEVILAGQLNSADKLIEIYSISKLFLFPSKFDTDGLVKREAAACLVPSVVLENTFASAEVVDNVNGYICKDSPEALAERIIEAISDEKKRKEVALKAKETLFWNWEAAVAKAVDIYKEVLNS